jgi:hypothetical protein
VAACYLLDTDWVIDHFNGIVAITRSLEQLRSSGLAFSVVSLAELCPEPSAYSHHRLRLACPKLLRQEEAKTG